METTTKSTGKWNGYVNVPGIGFVEAGIKMELTHVLPFSRERAPKTARINWTYDRTMGTIGPEDLIGHSPSPSVKGEDAESDKAWRAYNKKELNLARTFILKAMKASLNDQRASDHEYKLRYSRTAGCSCGCSPAFFADDDLHGDLLWRTGAKRIDDVFITIGIIGRR